MNIRSLRLIWANSRKRAAPRLVRLLLALPLSLATLLCGTIAAGQTKPSPEELSYLQSVSENYVVGTLVAGDLASATIRLDGKTRHVPLHTGAINAYGVSKGWLAFSAKSVSNREELFVMNVSGGSPVSVLTADRILRSSWRPGYAAISVVYQEAGATYVAIYDIEARNLRKVGSPPAGRPFLYWSRDGQTLHYITSGSPRATLLSYDVHLSPTSPQAVKPEYSTSRGGFPWTTPAGNEDPGPADADTVLANFDGTTDPNDFRTPLILIHGIEEGSVLWEDNIEQIAGTDTWDQFISYYNQSPDLQSTYKLYLFIYQSDLHSVWDIARSLRNHIDEDIYAHQILDGPFVIVAHSMGGLVARSYMSQHSTNQGDFKGLRGGERILKLITLGTPHHGSPIANGPSTDTLVANADARDQFPQDNTWADLDSLVQGLGELFGQTTSYNRVNRDDLWWDNYDGAMSGTQSYGDIKSLIGDLNNDTTYDGKISAFYGYYDLTARGVSSDFPAASWPVRLPRSRDSLAV